MWKTAKLKDVSRVFTDGDWIESKDQSVEGIRLVQTGNVKTGSFAGREDKARYISEETFKRLKCTEVIEGDILVSRLPEPVGRACVIPKLQHKAITAVDCTIIRTTEDVSPRYLNYYMQSPQYFSLVQEKVTGATRQRISRKNLGEVLVSIPPLAEQQRIVAKLDVAFAEIDRAIEIAETEKGNGTLLFNRTLQDCFVTGGDGWFRTTVGEQLTLQRGFDITKKEQKAGEVPVVSSGGVKSYHNEAKAKAPGVVIGRKGSLGTTHFLETDYFPHDTTLWIKDFKGNEPEFCYFFFLSLDVSGLDSGAANPALNRNNVHPLKTYWIDKSRQSEICKKFRELNEVTNSYVAAKTEKIQELNALKSAILAEELQPPHSEAA